MKILVSEKLSPHKFKTPEGYLICTDAILSRTGKQTYMRKEVFGDSCEDADNEIEIDRLPEEVFSEKAMASFENKPICIEHPNEDVNVENHNQYSVGYVRDIHKGEYEGQPVMLGTLVITDKNAIEDVESGKLTDLSCGYDCDIADEKHPQQRNIRGNHVALCEQGRAGIAHIVDSMKDKPVTGYWKVELSNGGDTFVWFAKADNKEEAIHKALRKSNKHGDRFFDVAAATWDEIDEAKKKWPYRVIDAVKDANRLPAKVKRDLEKFLTAKSTFIRNRDYDISEFVREFERVSRLWAEFPLTITREKIVGWNKMSDGMMRKDYYFSINGYDDEFMVSIYAKPDTYETTELNAYFTDSVKDEAQYVIYADGTWNNYRALFAKKEGAPKYSTERDADLFNEEEAKQKTLAKGKYTWVMKKVKDEMKDERIVNATELKKGMKFKRYDGIYTIVDIINHDKYIELITRFGNNTSTGAYNAEKNEKFHVIDSVKDDKLIEYNDYFGSPRSDEIDLGVSGSCIVHYDKLLNRSTIRFLGGSRYSPRKDIVVKGKIDTVEKLKKIINNHTSDSMKDARYEIVPVKGHFEIYRNGKLWATANSRYEAAEMIREDEAGDFMEDDLIESGSEEAFKKNVKTEIKAGKDPKQAVAIAYATKRANDATYKLSTAKNLKPGDKFTAEYVGNYGPKLKEPVVGIVISNEPGDKTYTRKITYKTAEGKTVTETWGENYIVDLSDSVKDSVENEIQHFENLLKIHKISIKAKGKTFTGRTHYQVEADKDFDLFITNLEAIEKVMKSSGIPMTFNAGSNGEGYCTAGIDLDFRKVNDSINTYSIKYKDQLYKVKAKSFADACLKLRKNL